MKTAFFGALALVLNCSLSLAQPAPGKTEAQLLAEKCRAAYANLESYRGTVKTNSVSLFDGEQEDDGGSATITFKKPNLLRIDGKLAGGSGDFSILNNAQGSWYRWPAENNGDWRKVADLSSAVASMTGVAGGAPTNISFLLMPLLGGNTFRFIENAKIEADETIDGQLCTKITARPASKTISWWIDKKTFLLRRILESYDEKQSAVMFAETQKFSEQFLKNNPQIEKPKMEMPKIEMRFVSDTEDFGIEAINSAVDAKLFAMPTTK